MIQIAAFLVLLAWSAFAAVALGLVWTALRTRRGLLPHEIEDWRREGRPGPRP
ncbi:MAG: hypothetical protein ACU0BS_12855 [Hasllibacter sp.]